MVNQSHMHSLQNLLKNCHWLTLAIVVIGKTFLAHLLLADRSCSLVTLTIAPCTSQRSICSITHVHGMFIRIQVLEFCTFSSSKNVTAMIENKQMYGKKRKCKPILVP